MKYKDILDLEKMTAKERMATDVAISFILRYVSPVFTRLFLKTKITPNQLTICMICSGILGALLFSLPYSILKVIGILFIWIWFILDFCDGEVARIKKQFSKFGKEFDYCAHVINHPLFALSFMLSIIQITKDYRIAILFFVLIIFNMAYRFYNCINYIYQIKTTDDTLLPTEFNMKPLKCAMIFVINVFVHFPNYALIFPVVYLFNYHFAIYYTLVVVAFNIIYIPYIYIYFFKKNIRI